MGGYFCTYYTALTPDQKNEWVKWLDIYHTKQIFKGEYLNLYDIANDSPEAHVIRKGDTLYYAFYADDWHGDIELRRLEAREYCVHDYADDRALGTITGPVAIIEIQFSDQLLIECVP